jgi:dihydroxy-acid dehydratase
LVADPANTSMIALYQELFLLYGLTPRELQNGRPAIGIGLSAHDLAPRNRAQLQTVKTAPRLCVGVRDADCVPFSFPIHLLQEFVRRPTAALDRYPAHLGRVEVLHGKTFDGVIFATGCDKNTPAAPMGAANTNFPALIFNGGPMLNSSLDGRPKGAGTIIWRARWRSAVREIDEARFVHLIANVAHDMRLGSCIARPGQSSVPSAAPSATPSSRQNNTR